MPVPYQTFPFVQYAPRRASSSRAVAPLPAFLQSRSRAAGRSPGPVAEDDPSLLSSLGGGVLSGLEGATNTLDTVTGASSLRDLIGLAGGGSWEKYNPFDQFLAPTSSENRVSGRELLRGGNIVGKEDTWGNFLGGLGLEMLLDPAGIPARPFGLAGRGAKGLSLFGAGLENVVDAIPSSAFRRARGTALGKAMAKGSDVAKRSASYLFEPAVRDQFSREGQAAGRAISQAEEELKPAIQAARSQNRKAFGDLNQEFQGEVGEDLLSALQNSPLMPDSRDVFQRASEMAQLEQHGFDEGTAAIRSFKSEHQGLMNQVRAAHNRGDDWDTIPNWDTTVDELRSGFDQYGHAGSEFQNWSDEDFWQAFLNPHDRPVRSDFIQNAFDEISGGGPATGGGGVPLRPGTAVDVHGNAIARRHGERLGGEAGEFLKGVDDLPGYATGFLTRTGSRESDVLFRKGDQFDLRKVSNEKIFQNASPQVQEQWTSHFFQKVSSDVERLGAETASLNPRSYEDALSRQFQRFGDLAEDQVQLDRYGRVFDKLRDAFGGESGSGVRQVGAVTSVKDTVFQKLDNLGLGTHWHTVDEGFSTDHYPRYVTSKMAREMRQAGYAPKDFNTAFESLKARRPEIRDLPTDTVEELLSNPRYRGRQSARRIMEDFGDMLDDAYGERPNPQGGFEFDDFDESNLNTIDDTGEGLDDSFNVRELEGGQSRTGGMPGGRQQQAEDLSEFVKSHERGTLFKQTLEADMDRYLRGAFRAQAGAMGLHRFLRTSANDVVFGAAQRGATVSLEKIYREIGMDVGKVSRYFEDHLGVDSNDFSSMRVSREAAATALGYRGILNPGKYLDGPLGDFIDSLNQSFKTGVTVLFPGFHFRNFVSGQVVNVTIGRADLKTYFQDLKQTAGLIKRFHKKTTTVDDMALMEEIFQHRVINPMHAGYGVEQAPLSVGEMADPSAIVPPANPWVSRQAAIEKLSQKNVPDWLQPFTNIPGATSVRATAQQAVGVGSNIGKSAEFLNRVAMYKNLRRQGADAASAAKRVEELHFDYSKSTAFESGVAKRVFPFWTFSRRMAELTARDLMENPGGRLSRVMRATTRAQGEGEEREGIPEYVSTTTSIPLGNLDDGTRRYLTGLGLAHEDPLSFLSFSADDGMPSVPDAMAELISRSSPLIKAPIEIAAGESFFQRGPTGGRELLDMDPTMGRLGSNVSELFGGPALESGSGRARPFVSTGFEHFMANTPVSRFLTTARSLTDQRKWEGGPFPGAWAAANSLTGLRISDVSPAARDAVMREQVQAYAREALGANAYTAVYFPKEEIEKTRKNDPRGAEKMENFNRLKQIFQKKREEREKKAEEISPWRSSVMPPGL